MGDNSSIGHAQVKSARKLPWFETPISLPRSGVGHILNSKSKAHNMRHVGKRQREHQTASEDKWYHHHPCKNVLFVRGNDIFRPYASTTGTSIYDVHIAVDCYRPLQRPLRGVSTGGSGGHPLALGILGDISDNMVEKASDLAHHLHQTFCKEGDQLPWYADCVAQVFHASLIEVTLRVRNPRPMIGSSFFCRRTKNK